MAMTRKKAKIKQKTLMQKQRTLANKEAKKAGTPEDKLAASEKVIEQYKQEHDGQLPDNLDMEEVKKMADAGFTVAGIYDDNNMPEDLKNNLEFLDKAIEAEEAAKKES